MISNLRHAAINRETVTIGGGEFGPSDLRLAAHMLDCYPDLLDALRRVMRHIPADAGGASLSDDMHRASKAMAKATAGT